MADAHKKGLNADLIAEDLEKCCRGEALCTKCQGKSCTIGFAKHCIQNYKAEPKKEDEEDLETAIAHILKECKDCKEDHTEDCIINVIRNCYEVGLLGDIHPYEGTALQYLMFLQENCPDKAQQIANIYANLR